VFDAPTYIVVPLADDDLRLVPNLLPIVYSPKVIDLGETLWIGDGVLY